MKEIHVMTRCTAARNRFVSVVYCVLCNALNSPARTACAACARLFLPPSLSPSLGLSVTLSTVTRSQQPENSFVT